MHLEGSLPNKTRGTGMLFGADVCRDFLRRCGLSLVVRSHEQVGGGFEWPFGSGEAALTVFSASEPTRRLSGGSREMPPCGPA